MSTATPRTDVRRRNNINLVGNPAGRPVVFAHGFGCSQEMWRYVTPEFMRDHLLVLFDQVGSGNSDLDAYDPVKYDSLHGYADDLLEIIEQFKLTQVVFVGHSVGCMTGILAAVKNPDPFAALVLVSPSPRYINDVDYVGGFERSDIDSLLEALDENHMAWSEAMAPVIMGTPDRPELGEELTDSFCKTDPEIARHFARVTFLSDNRRDLPLVRTPTLVLQAQEDAIAPVEVGQYVHQHIPGSELIMLEATGHCPNLSAPVSVATAIRGYLASRGMLPQPA